MSNLSNELFFEAHRGVGQPLEKPLGRHWSAQYSTAGDFAFWNHEKGIVVSAKIPMSSVETHTETLKDLEVGGKYAAEKEIPVKPGAPVYVTRTIRETDKRFRTRKYNPPREMRA
jgi:hypothetical protein